MEADVFETTEKILLAVTFIAMGGTAAIAFFFVFAQTITGSKRLQRQLEELEERTEHMIAVMEKIEEHLRNKGGSSQG